MLSCDYNGWTDAPEDEREELDRALSDVVRPDSRSPVATAERAAMTLTSQDAGASALLLMTVMVVATGIELFVLQRPPVAATACLCAHGIIAWNRRAHTRRLLAHRPHRSPLPVTVA